MHFQSGLAKMQRTLRSTASYHWTYNLFMSTVHLPNEASETLERAFGPNLDRAVLEALTIEGYRAAKLSAGEVARVLGLETSLAAQKWLADHGVEANYSIEDLHADRENLSKLFPDMG